ncbi:MAG: hypothetical protein K5931_09755, partial [Lachnospiraceae bacterium]|nr:hypothetical protein [Lachnospiraceae bacterium]
ITDKGKESICNQGIDRYLFTGAFYIMTEVNMDISSLGGVASAYSFANQIRNKSVSSSDFAIAPNIL